jgi:ATPase subunit of ABC transporter with duplicated ATPase domains
MSHIAVSGLAYAHPGGELLFSDVSFRLSPGRHAGLIGANGVGKSTLLPIPAGELSADEGDAATGVQVGYMASAVTSSLMNVPRTTAPSCAAATASCCWIATARCWRCRPTKRNSKR